MESKGKNDLPLTSITHRNKRIRGPNCSFHLPSRSVVVDVWPILIAHPETAITRYHQAFVVDWHAPAPIATAVKAVPRVRGNRKIGEVLEGRVAGTVRVEAGSGDSRRIGEEDGGVILNVNVRGRRVGNGSVGGRVEGQSESMDTALVVCCPCGGAVRMGQH